MHSLRKIINRIGLAKGRVIEPIATIINACMFENEKYILSPTYIFLTLQLVLGPIAQLVRAPDS